MKVATKISLSIAVVGVLSGWRQEVVHERAVKTYHEMRQRAAAAGVLLESGQQDGGAAKVSRRGRKADMRQAKDFASEWIAAAVKAQAKGQSVSRDEMDTFLERLIGFDAVQMNIVAEDIRASDAIDGDQRSALMAHCCSMFFRTHPREALAYLKTSPVKGAFQSFLISTGLSAWAYEDPGAAVDWVRRHADSHPDLIPDNAGTKLVSGAIRPDPELAIELVEEFDLDPDRAATLIANANTIYTSDQRRAVWNAVNSAGKPEFARRVLSAMARPLAENGFAEAESWLEDAALNESQLRSVVGGLSYEDARSETGRWIEWIGDQNIREDAAIKGMMKDWTRADYRAAGEWLTEAGEGRTRRVAVEAYAATVAPHDPEAGARWVGELPEGTERKDVARKVFEEWKLQDAAAARTFAEKEGLELE